NHPSIENISEGEIIYEVSFPDNQAHEISKDLLPAEFVLYFNQNKTCCEFNSVNGTINTRMISDTNKLTYSVLVNSKEQKMAKTFTEEYVKENFKNRVPLKIYFTENKKQIAGIECKEAICTDSTENTYSVYYSDNFKINEPNWATSFSEIPGVLMEYNVKINNIAMHLKAKSISSEKTDATLFIIPANLKSIMPVKKA
ncbi:MAG: hypothetical protein ABI855_12395, partial [Bacteroidota bacterium]